MNKFAAVDELIKNNIDVWWKLMFCIARRFWLLFQFYTHMKNSTVLFNSCIVR